MRQKISYDSGDYAGSVIIWIILIGCLCFFWWTPGGGSWGWSWWWWIIIFVLFFWWICALCFVPLDVYADDDEVRVRRPFKTRRIRMSDIQSVEPYQVSNPKGKSFKSSPIRSFGHWGHYSDDKIGDYFAYYGKPDNTVLITLKDGRKYVIGAQDAKQLSDYINERLNNDK